jgi:hypothetical protein
MIDAVLEALADGKPHTTHHIKNKVDIKDRKLIRLMEFLWNYDFVRQGVNFQGSVTYEINPAVRRFLETVRP